jgi:hypothetical protein
MPTCKKEEIQRLYLLSGILAENRLSREDALKLVMDLTECTYVYLNPQEILYITSRRFEGGYEVMVVMKNGRRIVFDVYDDEILPII